MNDPAMPRPHKDLTLAHGPQEMSFHGYRWGITLRKLRYQSDVYREKGRPYDRRRGLAVLGEGCRGVLDRKVEGAFLLSQFLANSIYSDFTEKMGVRRT